jgi:uncharacterized protein
MKVLNTIAQVLIVIGALNWGLIGLFDFNLVSALFGVDSFLTNTVYVLVGLAGLYGLYLIAAVARDPAAATTGGKFGRRHDSTAARTDASTTTRPETTGGRTANTPPRA